MTDRDDDRHDPDAPLAKEGTDIVASAVETHGLSATEPLVHRRPVSPRWPIAYAWAILSIAVVTAAGLLAYDYLALEDITVLYMLAVMIASLLGRGPSLAAATLAVAAFDVCFVPPRWTFVVADTRYVLTFIVMFAAGAVISTLVTRLRHQEREAIGREQRTATLLAFTRDVAAATSEEEVGAAVGRHIEATLDVAATVLVAPPTGGLVSVTGEMPLAEDEMAVVRWALEHRQIADHGTGALAGARVLCVPMIAGDVCAGVIAIRRRPGTALRLGVDQRHLIDALARQAATAIARVQLAEQAKQAALRARTEELRSSLLSAVSHDLRTPLAVITGAATSLRDDADHLTPAARRELLSSIIADAQRLARVLSNLLQLTRVENGLQPACEWLPAEEVIGSALTRLEDALRDHPVELDVPSDVMLQVDPVLFEQALLNLIENALKHGAPPLRIAARRVDQEVAGDVDTTAGGARAGQIHVEVADRGPGLPDGDASRLFEKFARASTAPGAGLGLAVVRAIIVAHGGRVVAETRDGGGAVFRIVLPAPAPPITVVRTEEPGAA